MSRKLLGPFNRVEGDLEVHYEAEGGVIQRAWVNSPLYRGFERILTNKPPLDALVYAPRICGICSVAQSVAAAKALAQAQGLQPAPNGELAARLILACENMADHLTHFYLFFMPDFARDVYQDRPWYEDIANRFRAQTGSAAPEVLKARAEWLHITGILAGKWPHSLSIQPGGSTRAIESQEQVRLLLMIRAFRDFLEKMVFADSLEQVTALSREDQLWEWAETHPQGDFARFLRISADLQLDLLGRASDNFLSYGAYASTDDTLFRQGIHLSGQIQNLDIGSIREDISSSWLHDSQTSRPPSQGKTKPDIDKQSAYSWCKAPRLDGQVMETGALARQVVDDQPLLCDLVAASGGNVQNRVIARLLEFARVIPAMESWCQQLAIRQPFCTHGQFEDGCEGTGLVEAARGSLGHWLKVERGKINNYQIIAPTTWNFSPRDSLDQPGALELALQGAPVSDSNSVAVQHVVRSFDPCMVCTVH